MPSDDEWQAEIYEANVTNIDTGYETIINFVLGGRRYTTDGSVISEDEIGDLWCSNPERETRSFRLQINSTRLR